jgi:hypothetical protein
MTLNGLKPQQLLVPGQEEKFTEFNDALVFFKDIAEKELSNAPISDDDYEKLRTYVKFNFPRMLWALSGDTMTERDARVGVVADIYTDAKTQQILYEAIGNPSIMYVAVSDKGGTRLTRGVVYSYYEFSQPIEKRLSDDDWQGYIYDGKPLSGSPQPAGWTSQLTAK